MPKEKQQPKAEPEALSEDYLAARATLAAGIWAGNPPQTYAQARAWATDHLPPPTLVINEKAHR
jgi:hypothetical protein